ncbi:hypothetical protein DFH94DRAFT_686756 [Russula ochroleuca]|uniref:Uncharacterized protein n=1 Tax=Russula ochroleuca TaxID=152965 RepID=A0A9P5JVG8_9AGAM|nr:hypothetical protein DFH94DRAFT_686756 [Russula ochroleuca]
MSSADSFNSDSSLIHQDLQMPREQEYAYFLLVLGLNNGRNLQNASLAVQICLEILAIEQKEYRSYRRAFETSEHTERVVPHVPIHLVPNSATWPRSLIKGTEQIALESGQQSTGVHLDLVSSWVGEIFNMSAIISGVLVLPTRKQLMQNCLSAHNSLTQRCTREGSPPSLAIELPSNLLPAPQAFSANLISDSSRASTNVTSTMHIKIGIVHFPNSMAQSISMYGIWSPPSTQGIDTIRRHQHRPEYQDDGSVPMMQMVKKPTASPLTLIRFESDVYHVGYEPFRGRLIRQGLSDGVIRHSLNLMWDEKLPFHVRKYKR